MGLQMVYSEILWKELEERFAKRNFVMTPNNRSQCYLPEGSLPLKND
jgi:molybdopterin-biosynthesis enzyme MoeA-like protein